MCSVLRIGSRAGTGYKTGWQNMCQNQEVAERLVAWLVGKLWGVNSRGKRKTASCPCTAQRLFAGLIGVVRSAAQDR